jgi:class 3 adenylate cyclase
MEPRQRRLSAILHADVCGFVRLMESEEDRTITLLKAAQREVWQPAIEASGGSLVNVAGDSILAEFSSAVAAVATAIVVQQRMVELNGTLDEDQRLMFRIGLHLGEVIVDEETHHIFGDGVNLAARIQAMAAPGGIAVSRAMRDVTDLQADYSFVDGGEHLAKNVSRPLHIYHVHSRSGASMQTTTSIVPHATLRFRGADPVGRTYGFYLDIERLMNQPEGVVIGRDFGQCEVVLPHATVSRRHARLRLGDNVLQIEDLGSTNGTSVDGQAAPAGAPRPLHVGAKLKIGDIELVVGGD